MLCVSATKIQTYFDQTPLYNWLMAFVTGGGVIRRRRRAAALKAAYVLTFFMAFMAFIGFGIAKQQTWEELETFELPSENMYVWIKSSHCFTYVFQCLCIYWNISIHSYYVVYSIICLYWLELLVPEERSDLWYLGAHQAMSSAEDPSADASN